MRLSATAVGKMEVPFPLTVLVRRYGISFFPSDDGPTLGQIDVVRPLVDDDDALPSMRATPGKATKFEVVIPRSRTEQDLLELLQYLESLGSLWLGIRKIEWEEATREWLPETPDEHRQLRLYSHQAKREPVVETPQPLDPQLVVEVIERRDADQWLTVPMAFWRQGTVDLQAGRCLSAVYQFFFFLEGLYADGEWRTAKVRERFLASQHLQEAARDSIPFLKDPRSRENLAGVRFLLEEYQLPFSPEGILRLVVSMRGPLHHFSRKSTQRHGHPLNQTEFRPLAVLLMQLATGAYPRIIRDGEPK